MKLEPGSELLITDLKVLLQKAEEGQFGDFTNSLYATPKVALRAYLLEMVGNVVKGKYDN